MTLRMPCQAGARRQERIRNRACGKSLWLALTLLAGCGSAPEPGSSAWRALDPAALATWQRAPGSPAEAARALRDRAKDLVLALSQGSDEATWAAQRAELKRVAHAVAHSPEAAGLPWADWIDEAARQSPEWAAHTLTAACAALGPGVLPIARSWDRREAPDALRLEVHRVLWWLDPGEAAPRANALLFREDPRAQDRLRPAYFEVVLGAIPEADALELLLRTASQDGMEHRARLIAIRELRARGAEAAPPILESIFLAERSNHALRREAFLALLELDRARGRLLLGRRHPDEQADPDFAAWLADLRAREGVRIG